MRKRLFYDKVSFTADTDDITIIQPRYIHDISIGLQMLQNGTTSPTLSEMLGILSRVQVKLTGRIVTEMTGGDLLAYNCLVQNRSIKYIVPTADNEYGFVDGLALPLRLGAGTHVLSVRFLHSSNAKIDTEKLTFATLESDEALEPEHVEIPTFSFTPPSTGAYNTALDSTFSGALHGLLLYSTTIPTKSGSTASLSKIRIKAGGDIVYEGTWNEMASQSFYPENDTLRDICDNYVFLDFSKAPIPAGTRIEIEIYSDDTNTVKILPIIRVPTA